jgi:hypothetical protein
MKKHLLIPLVVLTTFSPVAADSNPKDEVVSAAKKLADKDNYSWKTTVVVPEDAPFKPGPTEGKTEKNGLTYVVMSFFDNKMETVIKGDKAAALNPEGVWKSVDELGKEEGPGQFMALIIRNLKTPTKEAADLVSFSQNLKNEGDVFSSDLTTEGSKELQTWGSKDDPNRPTVTNAKGSVKFWLKDGVISKYEFKLKGTISFNGNELPNERTTTVEIKDQGTTKIEVPEAARKKVNQS